MENTSLQQIGWLPGKDHNAALLVGKENEDYLENPSVQLAFVYQHVLDPDQRQDNCREKR